MCLGRPASVSVHARASFSRRERETRQNPFFCAFSVLSRHFPSVSLLLCILVPPVKACLSCLLCVSPHLSELNSSLNHSLTEKSLALIFAFLYEFSAQRPSHALPRLVCSSASAPLVRYCIPAFSFPLSCLASPSFTSLHHIFPAITITIIVKPYHHYLTQRSPSSSSSSAGPFFPAIAFRVRAAPESKPHQHHLSKIGCHHTLPSAWIDLADST